MFIISYTSCFYQNIHHINVLDIYDSFASYTSCNIVGVKFISSRAVLRMKLFFFCVTKWPILCILFGYIVISDYFAFSEDPIWYVLPSVASLASDA